ncbi:hypothetical protein BGZ61DRAFT_538659 [Ilyonectria robusta]|uniref:uncharacterized protein n=1 Tax=Ilyonectria robusta TaxID=1079257 RepID=UPI001E8CE042|nr:uncharacterized protein BGZ61DRAFT_538659 [Ilyonectria robusta]KAH8665301.1 hypothetical protein BGZ61DRAFT_538659 [Ilyonectria robusta]
MARTRKDVDTGVDTRTLYRLRPVQPSPISRTKPSAHNALTRRQQPKPRSPSLDFSSSPERCPAGDEPIFPDEDNPLQEFSSATKSTIIAPYAIMGNETIDSSGRGLNGADLTLREYDDPPDLERKTKRTRLGEMGGGKDREHLEGRKSSGQRNNSNSKESNGADHTAELTEPEEQRDDTEEPKHEVEAIVGHTIYKRTKVKLRVKWAGDSKPTLVDECAFQEDCPTMLYSYWKSRGTREKATGIKLFHIFGICDWRVKDKLEFKVHWVGYPPEQSTWELAWRVKDFVEEMHAEYLETHPAARRAWEKEK